MDQELTDAAACVSGRRCMCIHQMAALFRVKKLHGLQLESRPPMASYRNPTVSRRLYLLIEEHTILPNFIPIRFVTTEP